MKRKISIVIPSFNSSITIKRTLGSIALQKYENIDLILVDGLSSDNTVALARESGLCFSHIICEKDTGQTNALNKGFRFATGEIFCWLCADDEFSEGALDAVNAFFDSNPELDMVTGGCLYSFSDGIKRKNDAHPSPFDNICIKNTIHQPSTFWRAATHHAAGVLDESYECAMDWEWWNRLKISNARIGIVARSLSVYNFSLSNKTSTQPDKNLRESYRIIKRYGPFDGALADVYKVIFEKFDLAGCYDSPPSASEEKMIEFWKVLEILIPIFGEDCIYNYNWNWISKQMRGSSFHL